MFELFAIRQVLLCVVFAPSQNFFANAISFAAAASQKRREPQKGDWPMTDVLVELERRRAAAALNILFHPPAKHAVLADND
ncbi:MAG: hypothetical protein AAFU55_02475, partial [Pseudomonadota bacterium]